MKPFEGTILVAGATGRTGQWIVRSLQERNLDYRLFVRSGTKAIELFGPEVIDRLVIGSIENDREVDAAVSNCSGVISAIGSYVTDPQAPSPSVIDREGLIRLATAARRHGVKKFVVVSSLAVTKPEHPLNKYGQVLTMKLEGENAVRELYSEPGFSYTILRPGGLLDGPPLQHTLQFDTGDRITGAIDRSDVAEVAVLSLTNPKAHNLTFELIRTNDAPQSSLEPFFDQL
jgi:nucleoside-diphosphate-sugar epimerase